MLTRAARKLHVEGRVLTEPGPEGTPLGSGCFTEFCNSLKHAPPRPAIKVEQCSSLLCISTHPAAGWRSVLAAECGEYLQHDAVVKAQDFGQVIHPRGRIHCNAPTK